MPAWPLTATQETPDIGEGDSSNAPLPGRKLTGTSQLTSEFHYWLGFVWLREGNRKGISSLGDKSLCPLKGQRVSVGSFVSAFNEEMCETSQTCFCGWFEAIAPLPSCTLKFIGCSDLRHVCDPFSTGALFSWPAQ